MSYKTGAGGATAFGRQVAVMNTAMAIVAYTVGPSDGSFEVSGNVNVTASVGHNFNMTCVYTDETGTLRTLTLTFSQLSGTLVAAITNVTGVGPYEGVPVHIRAKAGTTITLQTAGAFASVTYNVEAALTQLA